MIHKRVWVRSGIIEELDNSQVNQLLKVHDAIKCYYRELYGTAPRYKYPLSLKRLMKLTGLNSYQCRIAVMTLSNSIPYGLNTEPEILYQKIPSKRHPAKRFYQIFLRKNRGV